MRNVQIQNMIRKELGEMVEPSLRALREGLVATKQRAFVGKTGDIAYSAAEPDHKVRTATADRILDRYQSTSDACDAGYGADVVSVPEDSATPQDVEEGAGTQDGADQGSDIDQLDPTDHVLGEQVTKIDEELAQIDREVEGGEHKNGKEQ